MFVLWEEQRSECVGMRNVSCRNGKWVSVEEEPKEWECRSLADGWKGRSIGGGVR